MTNTITMIKNAEKQGIELYFTEKPDEQIRETLKAAGYRWHNVKKCWYAKESAETLAAAEKLVTVKKASKKAAAAPAAAPAPAPVKKAAAPVKKDGIALQNIFIENLGFPGEEVVYRVINVINKSKVEVKKSDGTVGKVEVKKTDKGNLYIVMNGNRCPLIVK